MKGKLATALCLIGLACICGAWNAWSADTIPGSVGEGEELLGAASGGWESEAVPAPRARVEKTGQTQTYGPRDDGKLRKGVAWPVPRFTDNGDGTVRDNLTGLTWLRNANCSKFYAGDATGHNSRDWNGALTAANKLADGYCGLTDGSVAGNWRLPNKKELESLIDYGFYWPALSNAAGTGKWTEGNAFSGVQQSNFYWSSTTYAYYSSSAWGVHFSSGDVYGYYKSNAPCVWPVR